MKTNFALIHHHKYTLSDIENMMPWEKKVYVDMIAAHIAREEEARRDAKIAMEAAKRNARR